MKKCPNCAGEIQDDSIYCSHCGKELMKKCPYCAEEIQDEAILCRYCGRELYSEYDTKKELLMKLLKSQIEEKEKFLVERRIFWQVQYNKMQGAERTDRAITGLIAPIGRLFMGKSKYPEDKRTEWVKEWYEKDVNVKVMRMLLSDDCERLEQLKNNKLSMNQIDALLK